MSSARERLNKARMLAAISPARVFLRITITHSSPASIVALPRRAEVDPVIVVPDEQQWRVEPCLAPC